MQNTTWASTAMFLAEDRRNQEPNPSGDSEELRQHLLALLTRVDLENEDPERLQESLLNIEQYLRGVLAEL